MYIPEHKSSSIMCGTGSTVIVTGWTPKEAVAKHLDPSQYAGISSLYSANPGINLLVRNLLANPQVKYLVVINATKEDQNSKSCSVLRDFLSNRFTKGITKSGKDCWLVNSEQEAHIDIEIKEYALNSLLTNLVWREYTSVKAAMGWVKELSHCVDVNTDLSERERLVFPYKEPESAPVLPGRYCGHLVQGQTIAETWLKIIHLIKNTGIVRGSAHAAQWQELLNVMAVVTDEPDDFYFPEPNYLPTSKEFMNSYVDQLLNDKEPGEGVKYTYGQRLRSWFGGHDQIQEVIDKLCVDINSSRAVMSLWDAGGNSNRVDGHSDHEEKDPPCLNHIHVRAVETAGGIYRLNLTGTFRSNDMFSAWPANAMQLAALQTYIVRAIGGQSKYKVAKGELTTISQSSHLYSDSWESVQETLDQHYQKVCKSSYDDPIGNFVIDIEKAKGVVVVKQMHPTTGEQVREYEGKDANRLVQGICACNRGINPEHAAYIGVEIGRAVTSLWSERTSYLQDRGK